MMGSIVKVLQHIRQDVARVLEREAILKVCAEVGLAWRQRLLEPVTTIQLFLLQILHGNTACAQVTHLGEADFSASAYCQARQRLPLALLQGLLHQSREVIAGSEPGRWRGHRTVLIDGSSFSMPDEPELQAHFGQPGGQRVGCGFPVAHLLALFDADSGLLLEAVAARLRTHDLAPAAQSQDVLRAGDVLVGDRGFCSYAHLALLAQRGVQAVLRMHQRQIVDFTPGRPHAQAPGAVGLPRSRWIEMLGLSDQGAEWVKPAKRLRWMSAEQYAALPAKLRVRELRYRVSTPGFRTQEITLVTTLLDAQRYPASALAALYYRRWRVEVALRALKQTMKMDVLKCKTVEGVRKELTMYALAYNLVQVVMIEAAHRQGVAVEQISFIDALRWLLHTRPGEALRLQVNPRRSGRVEPRVVKRRPKSYPRMTAPRTELRNRLLRQQEAA